MAIFKVNYFFHLDKRGWSETFFTLEMPTPEMALTAAKSIIPFRVKMLAQAPAPLKSPMLEEVRISDVAIQRDSLVFRVPDADGLATGLNDDVLTPFNSVLVRCESSSLYRRSLYIRGLPKRLMGGAGEYTPVPAWTKAFEAYADALIKAKLGIYAVKKPGVGVKGGAITGISSSAPGGEALISTGAPHLLADQDSVRIIAAPGTKGARGNWYVFVTSPTQFMLLGSSGKVTGVYAGGGKWAERKYDTQLFTSLVIEGLTHHDTGRPFDSPRGARRRKGAA